MGSKIPNVSKNSIAKQLEQQQRIIEEAKNKIKTLNKRQKEKERKERTHRLVTIGANIESALNRNLDKNESRLLALWLLAQEARGNWVSKALDGAFSCFREEDINEVSRIRDEQARQSFHFETQSNHCPSQSNNEPNESEELPY